MSQGPRLCLIDDDPLVRDAMALGLEDAGFTAFTTASAAAAFEAMSASAYDVLVTDVNMPGAGGAQIIPEARARWPAIAIVVISGAQSIGGRPIAEAASALGADAALIKPFRTRQLVETIREALEARAANSN
ncbi:MAG: response regulator [Hyphomonadaceae bacterium]